MGKDRGDGDGGCQRGGVKVGMLAVWGAEARAKAEADEKKHREDGVARWRVFAKSAVKNGGKRAHRWLKGPQGWHPEFAGSQGDPKYGPQEIGEECMGGWSEIWGCGGGGRGIWGNLR